MHRQNSSLQLIAFFFFFFFSFLVPSRAPSNVRVSNVRFDQLKVQWNALPQQFANGRLLGYTVYYYEYYNSYVIKSVSTRSPYVNRVILRGLKAASRYQIAVAAFTSKGAGTQSYWLYVTTGIFFIFVLFCFVFFFGIMLTTTIIIWLNPQVAKMQRILRSDWLPERARRAHVARLRFPTLVPYISFIDQACSVKMIGYWPPSFLHFH